MKLRHSDVEGSAPMNIYEAYLVLQEAILVKKLIAKMEQDIRELEDRGTKE